MVENTIKRIKSKLIIAFLKVATLIKKLKKVILHLSLFCSYSFKQNYHSNESKTCAAAFYLRI